MSYTSLQFLVYDSTTDANYRAWGSAVSAALSAMGMVQTADPQINWLTVTAPAANSFNSEFWRFADALQTGATQIFFRVDYGRSSAGAPRIRFTLGTGTTGSGALSGFITTTMDPLGNSTGTGAGVTNDCWFSGFTDRVGMLLWRSAGVNNACGFVIERTKDTSGANSSDGVTIVALGAAAGASPQQQTIAFGTGVANITASRSYVGFANGQNASGAFNNNIPMSPIFPDYGFYGNPLTTLGFVHTQDVAEGCFFTTTLYGATRTYIATGNFSVATPANSKACLRYD